MIYNIFYNILHLILENILNLLASIYTSVAGMSVNMANQASDILQYPMNNKVVCTAHV